MSTPIERLPPELLNRIIDLSDPFRAASPPIKIPVQFHRNGNPAPLRLTLRYPYSLPSVTRVNHHFRTKTIGRFYNKHTFVLFFFGKSQPVRDEIKACLEWLEGLGKGIAAALEDVRVVYSKKLDSHMFNRYLLPGMTYRGVRRGDPEETGVVRVQRIEYPFRQDVSSVLAWV